MKQLDPGQSERGREGEGGEREREREREGGGNERGLQTDNKDIYSHA